VTTHRPVYHYEVELKLVNGNTKEQRLVTSRQPAYSPMDAYMQAVLEAGEQAGSARIMLVHVRPVAEAIAASQLGLKEAMADMVKAALGKATG
jgi:hypothetical protein